MTANLRALIGKLNNTTREAMEAAAKLCAGRKHYEIEIEHFLLTLMDAPGSDLTLLLSHCGIDKELFSKDLSSSLERLKRGNPRNPAFSPHLVKLFQEAWTFGSLEYEAREICSGFAVIALLANEDLRRMLRETSREFARINLESLKQDFWSVVAESEEHHEQSLSEAPADEGKSDVLTSPGGKTPFLDQYTVNLTAQARAGKIDPVLARDVEIRQVVDILTRRRQNNPILVGEAGVGKTAVVEGFALRVARREVPPSLQNVTVRTLDLALLQAGAGVKGEFENRLKGLINEVKSSSIPIILFIDEAHTMIGAGGQAGQNDAANLLKPALARGELRTIAATTWSEYKKYFEKDPALARRFQLVKVEEPTEAACELMLRSLVPALELHHNVRILDEGLAAAVKLSHRYLPDRQLPDKAVSVLDTACARLSLGQNALPAALEDTGRTLDDLAVQVRVLQREAALGADHTSRLAEISEQRASLETQQALLRERWDKERSLVERIRDLRRQIENTSDGASQETKAPDPATLRAELTRLAEQLRELQGEAPLIGVCVDAQLIGDVVSGWTGIPVGKMLKDEVATVLALESHLGKRVVGQDHALGIISQRVRTSRAAMDDPNKPVGVFLLVGPSGVGKTETALALSDLLYGGERNVITINMSEFQEAHTVSTLKGSPPGYVGYGEGGVLTEAVRRRPYSVVLLDEIEKAHADVRELFFQVFDKGVMEDGEGRQINFKNSIIILTSNAGTETLMDYCTESGALPSLSALIDALKPELNQIFKPAFLGRTVIIPYLPISEEVLRVIIGLKLQKIKQRLAETHRIDFTWDAQIIGQVAARCTEVESGARNVDNILTNTLLPDVSRGLLSGMAEGRQHRAIHVTTDQSGAFAYQIKE